jgi:hypothetical protein
MPNPRSKNTNPKPLSFGKAREEKKKQTNKMSKP